MDPVTITSLQQDYIQGRKEGTGVPWVTGATMVHSRGTMAAEDASNAANAGTFGTLASFDGGRTYSLLDSGAWAGGTTPRGPNYPGGTRTFAIGDEPTHVLVFWDLPSPLSAGGDLIFS